MTHDVIVLGSGPAGLTAALYTSRANLKTLVIAGVQQGGQLMITTDVENYPGFPNGVQGPELMDLMRKQTERFGAEFVYDDATAVEFSRRPLRVSTAEKMFEGHAVIVATGAQAKWLGLENEKRLHGHGVSACATCDGFFFKEKRLVVVGGGDTAMEESLFLTKFASDVNIVHRRDKFRASKIMQDRVLRHPKISVIWDTAVTDVLGKEKVEGVRLQNVKTGEARNFECQGLFLAIGHEPSTKLFHGHIELDARGYVVTKQHTMTSVPGVFAAGDVRDARYRQAVTAAGDGCMAAIDAERWLEEQAHA